MARIHGYEPDETRPTTELLLRHTHPEDLSRAKALLECPSGPFRSWHRIRTASGETRTVVVVGDAVTDASGRTVASRGFYVDVTESFRADLEQEVSDQLRAIVAQRAVIEQTKGMLMALYGIGAEAAFDILKLRSQQLNVKVRDLATGLVNEPTSLMQFSPLLAHLQRRQ